MKKIFAFVILTSLALTLHAAGPHGTQPGWAIDDSGNILITDAVADRLAQSGAGWVRLNFRLGPYPSDTAEFYSRYDTVVNRLRSRGLQIIGLLCNEGWHGSQADWQANNWENTGGDGHNPYIDAFGYALARMAAHWQNQIKYWEIWNEPDCWNSNPAPGVYEGCSYIYPSNFAAMLAHCHSQVRYYNNIPVQIISGGLFAHDIAGFSWSGSGAAYLDATYNVGINHTGKFWWTMATYGSYPLDAVGQHIYISQGGSLNTSWFGTYLDYVRDVVSSWDSPKKTWLTEWGWTTASVSETTQANNINSAFNVIKGRSYVQCALQFQLEDNQAGNMYYGLFHPNLTKKPSWTRFNTQSTYQGKRSDGVTVTAILNKFNNSGGMAVNGSPYDNGGSAWAHWWDYGYVQDFDGGSIGNCAIFDTGRRVQMGFWQTYLQGDNHTRLRFPTTDEYSHAGGTRQDFQGGYMTWTPSSWVQVFYF